MWAYLVLILIMSINTIKLINIFIDNIWSLYGANFLFLWINDIVFSIKIYLESKWILMKGFSLALLTLVLLMVASSSAKHAKEE